MNCLKLHVFDVTIQTCNDALCALNLKNKGLRAVLSEPTHIGIHFVTACLEKQVEVDYKPNTLTERKPVNTGGIN